MLNIPGLRSTTPDQPYQPQERDFEADRRADRIVGVPALLRELKWTDSDLELASKFNFPIPEKSVYVGHVFPKRTPIYLRSAIAKWSTELKAIAIKAR